MLEDEEEYLGSVTVGMLIVQGIATSIDALSVGFTISDYRPLGAFVCSVVIAVVTLAICLVGVKLGKKVGSKIADKATIVGGLILIGIGLEILLKSLL